jgi:Ca-activated chloride channel family protein
VSGKVGEKEEKSDFPANLVEHSGDESLAFVEKLWAIRRVGEILDQLDLKGKNDELVKELVALSIRHGIITPYTSFLANENADVHNVTWRDRQAELRLDALSETDGQIGVEQRLAKAALRRADAPADQAPQFYAQAADKAQNGNGVAASGLSAPATAAAPQPHSGRFAFRGALGAGGLAPTAAPIGGQVAGEPAKDADDEAEKVVENVRVIGRKTFYRRGDHWVDSAVTAEQEQKPIKVERYGKEYFDLVDKYGHDAAKYLTFDEPVIVELGGKAYSF